MANSARFLRLFLASEADIRTFLRTLVPDPRELDDIVQSVALVLWEKFDSYDEQRSFGAWARGIAAKEVLAMRRQYCRCPTPFSPEVVASILDRFEERLQTPGIGRSEHMEALEHCLEALPTSSRKILNLRYGSAMSICEVAQHVGRTTAATQRALSRIRGRLGECVKQRLAAQRARN